MNHKTLKGYPLILSYLGMFSILIGAIILTPLLVIVFYHEEVDQIKYFLPVAIVLIFFRFTL